MEKLLTVEGLEEVLGCKVENLLIDTGKVEGGMTNIMTKFTVTLDGEDKTLLVKYNSGAVCNSLNLQREANFFNEMISSIDVPFPKIYYANSEFGADCGKVVIMEYLEGAQFGYLFGPHNPGTWSADIPAALAKFDPLSAAEAAAELFKIAARVHGRFTPAGTPALSWLRGLGNLEGSEEAKGKWQPFQDLIAGYWHRRAELRSEEAREWDPLLVEIMDRCVANCSFDRYVEENRRLHAEGLLHLVHGDLHPGNAVWLNEPLPSGERLVLFDWEMVGLGSGPQELAQALISHMAPAERREAEDALIDLYMSELLKVREAQRDASASDEAKQQAVLMPLRADVRREYARGGLSKWIWVFLYMIGLDANACPPRALRFFHDQLVAFVKDWGFHLEVDKPETTDGRSNYAGDLIPRS